MRRNRKTSPGPPRLSGPPHAQRNLLLRSLRGTACPFPKFNAIFENLSASLEEVTFSEGLTETGTYVFSECGALKELRLPDSLEIVNEGLCYKCTALESVRFGTGLRKIERLAFLETGLQSVDLPAGVTEVGSGAFFNCAILESLTLQDGLTTVYDSAFRQTALRSVHIPASVKLVEGAAFGACFDLAEITVDENNECYMAEDNILYSKDGTVLCQYNIARADESFTVPARSGRDLPLPRFGGLGSRQ